MPVTHRNRKGQMYYLHQGRTPKGKPKYFFSRKEEGNLVEQIPAGYETYEKPDTAQVYLRKPPKSRITAAERDFVQQECRRITGTNAVLVDVEGDSLVVYYAERNEEALERIAGSLGLPRFVSRASEAGVPDGHYEKLLRFTLRDDARRLYSTDRWCFRGRIDGWFPLSRSLPLEKVVRDSAPHLGQESYFELM